MALLSWKKRKKERSFIAEAGKASKRVSKQRGLWTYFLLPSQHSAPHYYCGWLAGSTTTTAQQVPLTSSRTPSSLRSINQSTLSFSLRSAILPLITSSWHGCRDTTGCGCVFTERAQVSRCGRAVKEAAPPIRTYTSVVLPPAVLLTHSLCVCRGAEQRVAVEQNRAEPSRAEKSKAKRSLAQKKYQSLIPAAGGRK